MNEEDLFGFSSVRITQKDIDRFWCKVDILSSDECWNWKAGKSKLWYNFYYGAFWIDSKTIGAHQFSFMISSKIDVLTMNNGKHLFEICHTCDNSSCVNPSHLYLGNSVTNARDRENRNRSRWKDYIVPPKVLKGKEKWLKSITGSNSKVAKLNEKIVKQVRLDFLVTDLQKETFCRQYAQRLNVSRDTIFLIVSNKSWKHVTIGETI